MIILFSNRNLGRIIRLSCMLSINNGSADERRARHCSPIEYVDVWYYYSTSSMCRDNSNTVRTGDYRYQLLVLLVLYCSLEMEIRVAGTREEGGTSISSTTVVQ